MKNKYSAILALALTWSSASGALITLNNGSGNTASGIQTTDLGTFRSGTVDGSAFTTGGGTSAGPGVVAFGFFSTDNLGSVASPASLASLFTQFGNTVTFNANGTTGNRSVFSSAQNVTVSGSSFADKFIYLFVGNGTTFLDSTEFLVAKSTLTFAQVADATPTPTVLTIRPDNSVNLLGTEITNVQTANVDTSTTAGWQTAALVPEPSSALLGLLGVVGLLRRRR
jgi:hypothetical protein